MGEIGASFKKVVAHVSAAIRAQADAHTQQLLLANTSADEYAKLGAGIGVNAFLKYVDAAGEERAEQIYGALDYMSTLAQATFSFFGRWPDVVPPPPTGVRGTSAPQQGSTEAAPPTDAQCRGHGVHQMPEAMDC